MTSGHKDSVTCATFSHDSKLVASGDMGGLIKVWKVESKEEIWSFEVGDLEVSDSIHRLQLASFTFSLKVYVREVIGLKWLMFSFCLFHFPQWLEWHPCAPVLLAGTADGNVWMWKVPGGDCKTLHGPGCQATSGKIMLDGMSPRVNFIMFSVSPYLWNQYCCSCKYLHFRNRTLKYQ